jgi:amino acid permease
VTIFSTEGEIMNIAGPAGLLVAWAYVAITSICVLEGLAEMIVMWPVSNAMVEFVKVFVDRDLAVVVGLSYWFAGPPPRFVCQRHKHLMLRIGTPGHPYS